MFCQLLLLALYSFSYVVKNLAQCLLNLSKNNPILPNIGKQIKLEIDIVHDVYVLILYIV